MHPSLAYSYSVGACPEWWTSDCWIQGHFGTQLVLSSHYHEQLDQPQLARFLLSQIPGWFRGWGHLEGALKVLGGEQRAFHEGHHSVRLRQVQELSVRRSSVAREI